MCACSAIAGRAARFRSMTRLSAESQAVDCRFGEPSARGSLHAPATMVSRGCRRLGLSRKGSSDNGLRRSERNRDGAEPPPDGMAQPMAQPMARRWQATTTTKREHLVWFPRPARARLRQRPRGLACLYLGWQLPTRMRSRRRATERSSPSTASEAHRELRHHAMA